MFHRFVSLGGEDPQEEEALDGGDNQAPALDEGEFPATAWLLARSSTAFCVPRLLDMQV